MPSYTQNTPPTSSPPSLFSPRLLQPPSKETRIQPPRQKAIAIGRKDLLRLRLRLSILRLSNLHHGPIKLNRRYHGPIAPTTGQDLALMVGTDEWRRPLRGRKVGMEGGWERGAVFPRGQDRAGVDRG